MRRLTLKKKQSAARVSPILLCLGLWSANLNASPTQFTIDESSSEITVEGKVIGSTLMPQGPGTNSLTTHFYGTILADVGATSVQFPGGSSLYARTNGVWEPAPGGGQGSAAADYGAQATVFLLGTVKGALRNLFLDMTSGALPMTNGQFSAGALVFSFPSNSTAAFDYSSILTSGGVALTGQSTNNIGSTGSLASVDGVQTLTIDIDAEFKFTAVTPNDSSVRLKGKLVATQSGSGAELTIGSIQVQGQTVTLRTSDTSANTTVQASANFKNWASQAATRTPDASGTVFTFPAAGDKSFYRLTQ